MMWLMMSHCHWSKARSVRLETWSSSSPDLPLPVQWTSVWLLAQAACQALASCRAVPALPLKLSIKRFVMISEFRPKTFNSGSCTLEYISKYILGISLIILLLPSVDTVPVQLSIWLFVWQAFIDKDLTSLTLTMTNVEWCKGRLEMSPDLGHGLTWLRTERSQ